MPLERSELLHHLLAVVGIRAPIAATAVFQLIVELHRANILDEPAVERIKDAIVREAYNASSSPLPRAEFATQLHLQLDLLFYLCGTSED
jgi:hypothetical protein